MQPIFCTVFCQGFARPGHRPLAPARQNPIPGPVLAGSAVFPGLGIEAVIISGTLAADALYPPAQRSEPSMLAEKRRKRQTTEGLLSLPVRGLLGSPGRADLGTGWRGSLVWGHGTH